MQSREILLKYIEANWDIHAPVIVSSFQTFPTREVLAISSGDNKFAVKIDSNPPTEIATKSVIDYLRQRSFTHCPQMIARRNGEFSLQINGTNIAIFEFIPVELCTPESWRKLGVVAAKLNQNFDYPRAYQVPPLGVIKELKSWCQGKAFQKSFLDILEKVEPCIGLTTLSGLVHGEVNFANARARENGEVVLLDWDNTGMGPIEIELGYPLLSVFLNPTTLVFDYKSATNYYSGYFSITSRSTVKTKTLWGFALLYALRSMTYFDSEHRWSRVQNALNRADDIIKVIG